jgi:hypothetical protein
MDKNIRRVFSKKNSEAGFALIAAIMACLILLALGMLVISLSTQDIRVSTKIVGEKRALAAAYTGINSLLQAHDQLANDAATDPGPFYRPDVVSNYRIKYPAKNPSGNSKVPSKRPWPGNSDYEWKLRNIDVVGINTEYNTQVTIGVWVGVAVETGGGGGTMQR